MAYVQYSSRTRDGLIEPYDTMAKIGTGYYYLGEHAELGNPKIKIMYDSSTGKYLVGATETTFMCMLIDIAYGDYDIVSFGYGSAAGALKNMSYKVFNYYLGFTDYFYREWVYEFKNPSGSLTYTAGESDLNTIAGDNTKYFDITAIASALGFTFSMEKNDTHEVQLVKAVLS